MGTIGLRCATAFAAGTLARGCKAGEAEVVDFARRLAALTTVTGFLTDGLRAEELAGLLVAVLVLAAARTFLLDVFVVAGFVASLPAGLLILAGFAGLLAFLAVFSACLACLIASFASRTARLALCKRDLASLTCCLSLSRCSLLGPAVEDLVLPDFKMTVDLLFFIVTRP